MNIEQRIQRLEEKVGGKKSLQESRYPQIWRKIEDAIYAINNLENEIRKEKINWGKK